MPETNIPPAAPENPTVKYERTDASFRWVLGVVIVALVVGIVLHVVVWFFFRAVQETEDVRKRSRYPLAPASLTKPPREPRLEQIDRMEGDQKPNVYLRESSRLQKLDSYGDTEEEGFIHIPIDKAIQLVGKTLKSRTAPKAEQQQRSGGLVDFGEPNSGRMFRRKAR